ncbi:hypothetical protein ACF1BK_03915 [Streptomyces globisporus]|uniref:hypothetical protein n=1 Tax=Streptomyces globisporus TaxID=1908 RepID=UPI0036F4C60D
MRLARTHKYTLPLKIVQRIHQAGHAEGWAAGAPLSAQIAFGPHTPTDRTAILEEVVGGVTAGVLSLETGIRMLQDTGYPIEDARQDVERIRDGRQSQAKTKPKPAASAAAEAEAGDVSE